MWSINTVLFLIYYCFGLGQRRRRKKKISRSIYGRVFCWVFQYSGLKRGYSLSLLWRRIFCYFSEKFITQCFELCYANVQGGHRSHLYLPGRTGLNSNSRAFSIFQMKMKRLYVYMCINLQLLVFVLFYFILFCLNFSSFSQSVLIKYINMYVVLSH